MEEKGQKTPHRRAGITGGKVNIISSRYKLQQVIHYDRLRNNLKDGEAGGFVVGSCGKEARQERKQKTGQEKNAQQKTVQTKILEDFGRRGKSYCEAGKRIP